MEKLQALPPPPQEIPPTQEIPENPHASYEQAERQPILEANEIICDTNPVAHDLARVMLDSVRPDRPPTEIESLALAHFLQKGSLVVLNDSLVTGSVVSPVAQARLETFIAAVPEQLAQTDLMERLVEDVKPYGGAGRLIDKTIKQESDARLGAIKAGLDEEFRGRLGDTHHGVDSTPEGRAAYVAATKEEFSSRRAQLNQLEAKRTQIRREDSSPRDGRGRLIKEVMRQKTAELLDGMGYEPSAEEDQHFSDMQSTTERIRDFLKEKLNDAKSGDVDEATLSRLAREALETVECLRALFEDPIPDSAPESAEPKNDTEPPEQEQPESGQPEPEAETETLTAKLDELYGRVDPQKEQPFELHPVTSSTIAVVLAKAIEYMRKDSNPTQSLLIAKMSVETGLAAMEYRKLRQRLSRKATIGAMVLRRAVERLEDAALPESEPE